MIAPDSSSSDLEWHKVLDEKEIDLLILDHHEIDRDIEGTPACVINNQDGSYLLVLLTIKMVHTLIQLYLLPEWYISSWVNLNKDISKN